VHFSVNMFSLLLFAIAYMTALYRPLMRTVLEITWIRKQVAV